MKVKQFLCLFALVSFIFSSCKKDDKDFRDKFEGTYESNIVDFLNLVDENGEKFLVWFFDNTENVIVNKFGAKQLMFIFERDHITVTVDEQGNFSIPSDSDKMEADTETGKITLNLTITGTGNITNKTLYIKETYSGYADIEFYSGEKIRLDLTGALVYNGKKIN
jgi:hypothetical protein